MEAMLPPLSPLTVVKVSLLQERPQERGSAGSQEMLLTLLNKRRKKYLARIRDHSITEGEPEKKSYELMPPSLYSDESSIKSNKLKLHKLLIRMVAGVNLEVNLCLIIGP